MELLQELNAAVFGDAMAVLMRDEKAIIAKQSPNSYYSNPMVSLLEQLMHTITPGFDRNHSGTNAEAGGNASTSASASYQSLYKDMKPHWKFQFFLGPPLSGAPFHHHGPALNFVLKGGEGYRLLYS